MLQNKLKRNRLRILNIARRKIAIRNLLLKRQILKNQINDKLRINIKELINNKNKPEVIPRNIFQAWHSNNLPNSVKFCIENIKRCNPNFNHYLYDEEQCREFIKEHFSEDILKAYDSIVPAAIKIDLWRYCVLYKYGGIYLDVKYFCVNGFNFNYLLDKEYFCKDIKDSGSGIYNAIIICKPNNEIMKKCIDEVVKNVNNKFYGNNGLEPSGPLMVKNFFTNNEFDKLKLNLNVEYIKDKTKININYNIFSILHFHDNYRNEQPNQNKHWSQYWEEKNMYI
jgi:mannosyltransferase OCH1-like enzyme